MVLKVNPVIMVLLVLLVLKEHKVPRVTLALKARLDLLVL